MENPNDTREFLDTLSGIKVTVTIQGNHYVVEIYIPEGTFRYTRSINYSNQMYQLKLESVDGADGPITLKLKKGYRKGRYGLIKNKQSVCNISKEKFFGKIILNQKFYIPADKRATSKNIKKAEEARNRCVVHEDSRPSPSKLTPYKVTNIAHPYSGGGMSSK